MADKSRLRWELQILACMYVGYMAFILCRTALYAAGPAMAADPALALTKTQFGAVLGWGTAGMVTGKLLSGAVADALGGRRVFLLALAITALCAGAFALAGSFALFCALNFAMLLAAAAGWPAMSKLIAAWYDPAKYGKVWGLISTSSRLSSMLSTFLLGSLLLKTSWHGLFYASCAVGLLIAAGVFVFLKAAPSAVGLEAPRSAAGPSGPHPFDGLSIGSALAAFARSGRFWLMCVSLMCTTVLMEVIGFLPLYLSETLGVSPAQAARAASVFPAGCLVALIGGGWVYDRVSRPGRAVLLGGLLALSALCLGALLALGRLGLSPSGAFWATALILFLYGLTVAPAYYLPMSVFSIEFGGPHCGLLIGLIDAAGYGAAMLYQFGGGRLIDRPGGWNSMLWLLLAVSAAATATTAAFARKDAREAA